MAQELSVDAGAGRPNGTDPGWPIRPSWGPVGVRPEDPQYGDLVRGVNQRYVGSPEVVWLVESTEQVVDVVQYAVRAGKRLTVRSGGHCLEDFVFNPDVELVLDLSRLNRVQYDDSRRAFSVESGAQLLEVYSLLYQVWGVTLPAGICYSVAAGGHVTGAGWGLLCRQLGLVIDYLYAVEVVVVDAEGHARTVVATREPSDPNRDLWWAHAGGGGGNFGVVTRFWFRSPDATGRDPRAALPSPPSEVLISAVTWPWADMTRERFVTLVRNYGAWFTANSAPGDPHLPLASFMVLNHRSHGQIGMVTQVDATVPGAERLLGSYLESINRDLDVRRGPMTSGMGEFAAMPGASVPRRLPWLEATRYLGLTNEHLTDPTLRAEYKSAYMKANFPRRHAEVMYEHLARDDYDNPGASVTLSSYGGEVNSVGQNDTAYPHRSSFYKMMWMVMWQEEADDEANMAWTRDFYADLYRDTGGVPVPGDVTDGCYVNYPDNDLNDPRLNFSGVPWHDLYYKDNYPRLIRIKQEWDPRNTFRHRQSVRLPGSAD